MSLNKTISFAENLGMAQRAGMREGGKGEIVGHVVMFLRHYKSMCT